MNQLTVFDIADGFLAMESVTHKKLQKLCYYAYSWYLTLYDKRLFPHTFEAWIHGPVQPQLYQKYKHTGWQPIPCQEKIPHILVMKCKSFYSRYTIPMAI